MAELSEEVTVQQQVSQLVQGCEGCQQLTQELKKLHADHALHYTTLKDKIISTDKLIKRYTAKCQYDVQSKKAEDASRRTEQYKRDCEALEFQLKTALEEAGPLKQHVQQLDRTTLKNEQTIQALRDSVKAAEVFQQQLEAKQAHLEREKSEIESKLRIQTQTVKDLENKNKKLESAVKRVEGENERRRIEHSDCRKKIKRLNNKKSTLKFRMVSYRMILERHGLMHEARQLSRTEVKQEVVSSEDSSEDDHQDPGEGTSAGPAEFPVLEVKKEESEEFEDVDRLFEKIFAEMSPHASDEDRGLLADLWSPMSPALSALSSDNDAEDEAGSEDDIFAESADLLEAKLLNVPRKKSSRRAASVSSLEQKSRPRRTRRGRLVESTLVADGVLEVQESLSDPEQDCFETVPFSEFSGTPNIPRMSELAKDLDLSSSESDSDKEKSNDSVIEKRVTRSKRKTQSILPVKDAPVVKTEDDKVFKAPLPVSPLRTRSRKQRSGNKSQEDGRRFTRSMSCPSESGQEDPVALPTKSASVDVAEIIIKDEEDEVSDAQPKPRQTRLLRSSSHSETSSESESDGESGQHSPHALRKNTQKSKSTMEGSDKKGKTKEIEKNKSHSPCSKVTRPATRRSPRQSLSDSELSDGCMETNEPKASEVLSETTREISGDPMIAKNVKSRKSPFQNKSKKPTMSSPNGAHNSSVPSYLSSSESEPEELKESCKDGFNKMGAKRKTKTVKNLSGQSYPPNNERQIKDIGEEDSQGESQDDISSDITTDTLAKSNSVQMCQEILSQIITTCVSNQQKQVCNDNDKSEAEQGNRPKNTVAIEMDSLQSTPSAIDKDNPCGMSAQPTLIQELMDTLDLKTSNPPQDTSEWSQKSKSCEMNSKSSPRHIGRIHRKDEKSPSNLKRQLSIDILDDEIQNSKMLSPNKSKRKVIKRQGTEICLSQDEEDTFGGSATNHQDCSLPKSRSSGMDINHTESSKGDRGSKRTSSLVAPVGSNSSPKPEHSTSIENRHVSLRGENSDQVQHAFKLYVKPRIDSEQGKSDHKPGSTESSETVEEKNISHDRIEPHSSGPNVSAKHSDRALHGAGDSSIKNSRIVENKNTDAKHKQFPDENSSSLLGAGDAGIQGKPCAQDDPALLGAGDAGIQGKPCAQDDAALLGAGDAGIQGKPCPQDDPALLGAGDAGIQGKPCPQDDPARICDNNNKTMAPDTPAVCQYGSDDFDVDSHADPVTEDLDVMVVFDEDVADEEDLDDLPDVPSQSCPDSPLSSSAVEEPIAGPSDNRPDTPLSGLSLDEPIAGPSDSRPDTPASGAISPPMSDTQSVLSSLPPSPLAQDGHTTPISPLSPEPQSPMSFMGGEVYMQPISPLPPTPERPRLVRTPTPLALSPLSPIPPARTPIQHSNAILPVSRTSKSRARTTPSAKAKSPGATLSTLSSAPRPTALPLNQSKQNFSIKSRDRKSLSSGDTSHMSHLQDEENLSATSTLSLGNKRRIARPQQSNTSTLKAIRNIQAKLEGEPPAMTSPPKVLRTRRASRKSLGAESESSASSQAIKRKRGKQSSETMATVPSASSRVKSEPVVTSPKASPAGDRTTQVKKARTMENRALDRELHFLMKLRGGGLETIAKKIMDMRCEKEQVIHGVIKLLVNNECDLLMTLYTSCSKITDLTAWSPVLADHESRVVRLLLLLEDSKSWTGLCDHFLSVVTEKVLEKKGIILAKMSLSRVCAGICRQLGLSERLRIFLYIIVHTQVSGYSSLLTGVAGVWPEVLHKRKHGSPDPVLKVLEFVVMRNLPHKLSICMKKLLHWEVPEADNTTIAKELIDRLLEVTSGGQRAQLYTDVSFTLEKSLELLVAVNTWAWVNDVLIIELMWPLLQSWVVNREESKVSDLLATYLLRILGSIACLCPEKCRDSMEGVVANLAAIVSGKVAENIPVEAQVSAMESLLCLTPFDRQLVATTATNWVRSHIEDIKTRPQFMMKLQEFSDLYRKNLDIDDLLHT